MNEQSQSSSSRTENADLAVALPWYCTITRAQWKVLAALVPVYGQMGRNPSALMALGPLLGFFGHGYFSLFGSLRNPLPRR